MTAVRAFPWASVDVISAADARVLDLFARRLQRGVPSARVASLLSELLGAPVRFSVKRLQAAAEAPDAAATALALRIGGEVVVVEAERALVRALLARLAAPLAATPGSPAALAELGALAVRLGRRLRGDSDVALVEAGPAPTVLAKGHVARPVGATLTMLLDADAYALRIVASTTFAASDASVDARTAVACLGDAKIALSIVGGVAWAPAREVAQLRLGDVWLPATRSDPLGATPVLLAATRSTRGLAAKLERDGRLVLGDESMDLSLPSAAEDTLLETVLDAPVVVRVELGTVELTAREWSSLTPGAVVATGTRIGAPAVLRAGGAELGRGELVEIDGAVGVRITHLAGRP